MVLLVAGSANAHVGVTDPGSLAVGSGPPLWRAGPSRPGMARACGLAGPILGLLSATMLVGVAGPLQSRAERQSLGRWLDVTTAPWRVLGWHPALLIAVVLPTAGLLLAWLLLVSWCWLTPRDRPSWWVATVVWCGPFVLAVPIFSRDAYAYVAQGVLVGQGVDPYRQPVAALVAHPKVLAAVDPVWRHTLTPYGPVGLRIEQLFAAAGGDQQEWRSLLAVRLLACAAVAVTACCIWRVAPAPYRRVAVSLWLSPLVLVHLIGAGHLDAMLCALLAGSVLAASRDHPYLAVGLSTLAGEIKATGFIFLPVLLLIILHSRGRRVVVQSIASGGLTLALSCAVFVKDPFGWLGALSTPATAWDPFTPASTVALAISEAATHLGGSPSPFVVSLCRLAAAVLGVIAGTWLLTRYRRNGLPLTCALLLLDVAMTGPALWPWYLTSSLALLLMTPRPGAWILVVVTNAIAIFLGLPLHVVPAQRVAALAELLLLGGVLIAIRVRRARQRTPRIETSLA